MRHLARWIRQCALLLGPLTLVCMTASAQPKDASPEIDKARNFFEAGSEAFNAGEYTAAAEAFLKAYDLVPSPALQFSAAQAYRRHFLSGGSEVSLKSAIRLYRAYLRDDKKQKRREQALEALAGLLPMTKRARPEPPKPPVAVEAPADADPANADPPAGDPPDGAPAPVPEPTPAPKPPAPVEPAKTRVLLSSGANEATISLDGGGYQSAPLVAVVTPGAHDVRIRAAGFHDKALSVVAVRGELVPRHVPLEPKPGALVVNGPDGAVVHIDGDKRGALPLAPLSAPAGSHFVTVTLNGHHAFSEVVELRRDEQAALDTALPVTSQRYVAWTLIGTGIAGAVVSGALTGVMISNQNDAVDVQDASAAGGLTTAQRDNYNDSVDARDDFGLAAALSGGAALLTLGTGLALYGFDQPETPTRPVDRDAPAAPEPSVEFTVGIGSLRLRHRF